MYTGTIQRLADSISGREILTLFFNIINNFSKAIAIHFDY